MLTPSYLGKTILSIILSFLFSFLLVQQVFYPFLPAVRPEFQKTIIESPKLIADATTKLTNQAVLKWQEITQLVPPHRPTAILPPPWTSSDSSVVPPTNPSTSLRASPSTEFIPSTVEGLRTSPPPTINNPSTSLRASPPPTTTPPPAGGPTTTPIPPAGSLTQEEQETINLINQRRQQMGLSSLTVNFQLVAAARRHSKDMSSSGFCGHTGSDNSTPWTRAREAGYTGRVYGETVGCGYSTASAIVDAWWNSPGHKAVLTYSGATVIGMGWWEKRQTAVVGY